VRFGEIPEFKSNEVSYVNDTYDKIYTNLGVKGTGPSGSRMYRVRL